MNNVIKIAPTVFKPLNEKQETNNFQELKPERCLLTIGGDTWVEAESGVYEAKCTHIDPYQTFMGNPKLTVYFTINNQEKLTRARLFLARRKECLATKMGADFGGRSKFAQVIKKLYPELLVAGSASIDPTELFLGREFQITVELKSGKSPQSPKNAIVVDISHPDLGW